MLPRCKRPNTHTHTLLATCNWEVRGVSPRHQRLQHKGPNSSNNSYRTRLVNNPWGRAREWKQQQQMNTRSVLPISHLARTRFRALHFPESIALPTCIPKKNIPINHSNPPQKPRKMLKLFGWLINEVTQETMWVSPRPPLTEPLNHGNLGAMDVCESVCVCSKKSEKKKTKSRHSVHRLSHM